MLKSFLTNLWYAEKFTSYLLTRVNLLFMILYDGIVFNIDCADYSVAIIFSAVKERMLFSRAARAVHGRGGQQSRAARAVHGRGGQQSRAARAVHGRGGQQSTDLWPTKNLNIHRLALNNYSQKTEEAKVYFYNHFFRLIHIWILCRGIHLYTYIRELYFWGFRQDKYTASVAPR